MGEKSRPGGWGMRPERTSQANTSFAPVRCSECNRPLWAGAWPWCGGNPEAHDR
jgi:hypothetical protein